MTLVGQVMDCRFTESKPIRLIGDKAYDSEVLDERLRQDRVEMIAPHIAPANAEPKMVVRCNDTSAGGRSSGSSRGFTTSGVS